MEAPSPAKSISKCMTESTQKKMDRTYIRYNEVEEWLLSHEFMHPEFNKYAQEHNCLSVIIAQHEGTLIS